MTKIDINKALFTQLKNDYTSHKENKFYQSELQSGFDYMEAMIKFFGSISISVVKDIDTEIYKNVFTNNFKMAPSLGDFKSLTTRSFPQIPTKKKEKAIELQQRLKNNNQIYDFLSKLFNTVKEIKLIKVDSILNDNIEEITLKSTWELLEQYCVSFRNKLKGHGASFKDNDYKQRTLILDNLNQLIRYLERNYDEIANNIDFSLDEDNTIDIEYKETNCKLLPILSYIECDKFSCSKNHMTKLFFYNDGKETKSHYIDYSYNHFHQVTQINEIYNSLKELQEEVLHSSSDMVRQTHLLSNFVGREKELQETKNHIVDAIKNKQSSFFSIMGIPGIGKSAFLTQLQQDMVEDEALKDELNTYTFYVQKDKMGGGTEEEKYFWKKLSAYFARQQITIDQEKKEDVFCLRDNLENLFNVYEKNKTTKPLLLIIDGLDEFSNASSIIKNIPLTFTKKIHLIYSSRPYQKIKDAISSALVEDNTLNVLNKETLAKEGFSFELGKLLIGEVEELLSRVFSKDIPRDSKEYWTIVQTIAEQSDSLPLYIYYITQELKEKNIEDSNNIVQEIKDWATQLPPKLDRFYLDRFKSSSALSRNILQMLFFSRSSVSKEDFYTVLKTCIPEEFKDVNFKTIDQVSFIENSFNDIEVFLSIDSDSNYSFYHLSVKEQLLEYFKELKQAFTFNTDNLKDILFEKIVEHNDDYIKGMVYLKKSSDLYNLLSKLTEFVNVNDTPMYYKNNYFHLLNTFTWSNIHISQINHEDMKNKTYDALLKMSELPASNKEEINIFFTLFENKENKYLYEIRYAYELAFISKDYTRVLEYKDMYEQFAQDMFLEIALNIDKLEYIQKFIEHKDDWIASVNENVQGVLISVMCQQEILDDRIYDIFSSFLYRDKMTLISKCSLHKSLNIVKDMKYPAGVLSEIASNLDDLDKALEIISNISEEKYKASALLKIAFKTDNKILLEKVLELSNSIEDEKIKSEILMTIVSNTDNKILLDRVLEIDKRVENDKHISRIHIKIALKQGALEEILEIVSKEFTIIEVCEKFYKGRSSANRHKMLVTIISYIDELDVALCLANCIRNESLKSKALAIIVSKTEDKVLLETILKITNNFIDKHCQLKVLAVLVNKIHSDILWKTILEIINYLDKTEKSNVLLAECCRIIASKINCFEKALDILKYIRSNRDQSLADIAINRGNIKEAVVFASKIKGSIEKLSTLITIASKTEDKAVLKNILKISDSIYNNSLKNWCLNKIIYKTDDLKVKLIIWDNIDSPYYKKDGLARIVSKEENIEKVLEENIEKVLDHYEDRHRQRILVLIVSKMNNIKKSFEVIKDIDNDNDMAQALVHIASKTNNKVILDEILKSSFLPTEGYLPELLALIASKTNDKVLLEESFDIIEEMKERDYRLMFSIAGGIAGVERRKEKMLTAMASHTDNTSKAIDIADRIRHPRNRSKAFSAIAAKRTNVKEGLSVVSYIDYDEDKIEALLLLLSKTTSPELIDEIFDITASFTNSQRYTILKEIAIKQSDDFTSLLFNQLFNRETNILETIDLITELSSDDILKYYGIKVEENKLEPIMIKLEKLKNQRNQAEIDEEESLYESLSLEAESIKTSMLSDETILNEYLNQYELKKMKFKSHDILELI